MSQVSRVFRATLPIPQADPQYKKLVSRGKLDVATSGHTHTGITVIRKTANETVTNSTTLQDDDELKLPLAANEIWSFHIFLWVAGPEAGDIKLQITVPSGATPTWAARAPTGSATTGLTAVNWVQFAGPAGSGSASIGVDNTQSMIEIWGLVRNGANAGNLQLQWAQATADVGNTIVYADSYLLGIRQGGDGGSGAGGSSHAAITMSGAYDYITLSGQDIVRGQIDLTTDVTGDLPYANLVQATAVSKLLGRGSAAGAGDWQEITLGTNLSMSGTTLNATGGGGGGDDAMTRRAMVM